MGLSEECVGLNCQCCKCASNAYKCCIDHEDMACPDDENAFFPDYVCPDFVPRKEELTDAPD